MSAMPREGRTVAAILNPLDGVIYAREDDARRWLASGDWIESTVGSMLRDTARRIPDAPAFITDERSISFAELDAESECAGAGLLQIGLRAGDRVIVQLGTTIETVVALMALYKAGLIPVCAIPQYREVEIGQLIRLSGARGYLVQADFSGFDLPAFAANMRDEHRTMEHIVVVRGARPEVGPDLDSVRSAMNPDEAAATLADIPLGPGDVLSFQLSGGTTGVPKIIPRFHAEYLGHSAAGMRRFGFGGQHRMIWPLPLLHNAGQLYALMPPLILGSSTVLLPRLDIARFFELIEAHAVTHAISIGPVGAQITNYPDLARHNFSSLKMFGTMSGARPLEQQIGVPCVNFYGITEGLLLGSSPTDPPALRHDSNGWSGASCDELKLVDVESGATVPPGCEGELAFRGPSTLRGYFAAPEATAEVIDADGFFRSGDIMRPVTVDGITGYAFQGRMRDNINRGGEKISCEEVEALVAGHPDIAEARLVAMPDPVYGEKGCIFIVPRPGAALPTVANLVSFLVAKGIAKFKCPERVEEIDQFPLTRVGKLDRAALRRAIADKLAQEAQVSAKNT